MWALAYLIVLLIGVFIACFERRYLLAMAQIGLILLPVASHCGYLSPPPKRYDASQYQFLIGKSRKEVLKAIGYPRGYSTRPAPSGEDIAVEYESYNEMLIRYSDDKHVAEVLPDF